MFFKKTKEKGFPKEPLCDQNPLLMDYTVVQSEVARLVSVTVNVL